jgi:5'-methylthioadenosine phosphorylase
MDFAVIGGTGLYNLADESAGRLEVATPYGPAVVDRVRLGGVETAFLARHGIGHNLPPHRVNYRANIAALQALGVRNILASASVGSISQVMAPGSLVALTQFLDFTRARAATFFDGEEGEVVHVDMTEPYCPHLRSELASAAGALGERLLVRGTYVCAEGPRFETPAEIEMFRRLGGDLVGMTNVPEVVLAREAGICYAAVAVVTNWAAGISGEPVKHHQVSDFMGQHVARLRALFEAVIVCHRDVECPCRGPVER